MTFLSWLTGVRRHPLPNCRQLLVTLDEAAHTGDYDKALAAYAALRLCYLRLVDFVEHGR